MVNLSKNPNLAYKLSFFAMLISFAGVSYGLYFIKNISENVRTSKVRLEETKRDIALLDKISSDKNLYRNEIKKIKDTLPSEYYEFSFFTDRLNTLARNNNLSLEGTIDKKKTDEKHKYDSVSYLLKINGSYSGIATFLSQLSKLPYHTAIDQLKMKTDQGILTTDVKFRIFVSK